MDNCVYLSTTMSGMKPARPCQATERETYLHMSVKVRVITRC
jgi:hypothetical protein